MKYVVLTGVLALSGCGQLGLPSLEGVPTASDPQDLGAEDPVLEAPPDVEVVELEPPLIEAPVVVEPEPVVNEGGLTLTTLGNAAEPGLWLKTPIVTTEGRGTIRSQETGKSVEVTLIPIDAPATAGSRASLAAMQALGVGLTSVAEISVQVL